MDSAQEPVVKKKRVLAPYMFGHKPVLIKPPKEKKLKEPIQEVPSNQRARILNRLLHTVEKVYKIPKTQPLPAAAPFVDPNDESSSPSPNHSEIDDEIKSFSEPIDKDNAEPSAESDQDEEVENSSEPEDENETTDDGESPAASSKSPSVSSAGEYDSEPAADKRQLSESDQEEDDENSSELADEESEASDDGKSLAASSKSPLVSSEGEYDSEPAADKRQLAESDQEEEESETSDASESAAASSTSPPDSSSEEYEESKPSVKQKEALLKKRKIKEKERKVQWKKPVSSEEEYDSEPATDRKGKRQLSKDPLHEIRRNIHPPADFDEIRQRLLSPLGVIRPQNERSHQEKTKVDDVGSEVNEPHPCEMRGCRNNEDEPIRPPTAPSYTAWWERPLRDGIERRQPDFDAKKRWSRKRIPAPPINFEDPRRVNSRHCCGYNQ